MYACMHPAHSLHCSLDTARRRVCPLNSLRRERMMGYSMVDVVVGKGRGRQVIAVARTSDLVLMMLVGTRPSCVILFRSCYRELVILKIYGEFSHHFSTNYIHTRHTSKHVSLSYRTGYWGVQDGPCERGRWETDSVYHDEPL